MRAQCVVHVTFYRNVHLSVVSCALHCAVLCCLSHAPSEPAIKVNARDVIEEERATPTYTR